MEIVHRDGTPILLESDDFGTHELDLRPAAKDPNSCMLSFSECVLVKRTDGQVNTLFRTSTSVPGEEFAVISAVGPDLLKVGLHSKPAN